MIALRTTLLACAIGTAFAARAQDQELPPAVRLLDVGDLAKNQNVDDPENGMPAGAVLGDIAGFASRFIRPPLRAGEEIKSLGDNTLVALARARQHAWLKRFVALNKKLAPHLMDVECQFVQMDAASFKKAVLPLLTRQGNRVQQVVLNRGPKTDRFLTALQKLRGVQLLQAPRLAVWPAQRANLSILSQTSYVKDFRTTFDDAGKPKSIDPVNDIVRDGMVLDCKCGMIEEGRVGLSVHALWCDLKQPIKKVELAVNGIRKKLQIEVPEVDVAEVKADVRMPLGGAVLFELPRTNKKAAHTIVFVKVRRTALPESDEPKEKK